MELARLAQLEHKFETVLEVVEAIAGAAINETHPAMGQGRQTARAELELARLHESAVQCVHAHGLDDLARVLDQTGHDHLPQDQAELLDRDDLLVHERLQDALALLQMEDVDGLVALDVDQAIGETEPGQEPILLSDHEHGERSTAALIPKWHAPLSAT